MKRLSAKEKIKKLKNKKIRHEKILKMKKNSINQKTEISIIMISWLWIPQLSFQG